MTDSSFKVKNTLWVNNAIQANSGGIYFSNTLTINSSIYVGTSNNTSYVGSVIADNVVSNGQLSSNLANYQTTAGLSSNVAGLTANNTSYVGSVTAGNVVSNGQLSSNLANYQTTAGLSSNVAGLTANNASYLGGVISTSYVNTSGQYIFSNVITHYANLILGSTASLYANGALGSANQFLTSNGTVPYWSSITDTTNATNIASGTLSQARLSNVLLSNVTNQTINGGAIVTSHSLSIGSFTANSGICPLQYITNNGAFTITAPSNDGTMLLLVTNGTAANTITFTGFTVGSSTGDALAYTSGYMFMISIMRINSYSTYTIKALQ